MDFLILGMVVGAGALLGIGIGMLLARRMFDRMEREDEEPGDGDD